MWTYLAKRPKMYMGRRMPAGCIYGRDDVSPFMCEMYRTSEKEGRMCTLLVERLDMMNGWWKPSYECNATTVAIRDVVMKNGMRTVKMDRYAPRVSTARVNSKKKTSNVTFNTYSSKMPQIKYADGGVNSFFNRQKTVLV